MGDLDPKDKYRPDEFDAHGYSNDLETLFNHLIAGLAIIIAVIVIILLMEFTADKKVDKAIQVQDPSIAQQQDVIKVLQETIMSMQDRINELEKKVERERRSMRESDMKLAKLESHRIAFEERYRHVKVRAHNEEGLRYETARILGDLGITHIDIRP